MNEIFIFLTYPVRPIKANSVIECISGAVRITGLPVSVQSVVRAHIATKHGTLIQGKHGVKQG